VAALVGNVPRLHDSVIIAENAAPDKPRCLMAYALGQRPPHRWGAWWTRGASCDHLVGADQARASRPPPTSH